MARIATSIHICPLILISYFNIPKNRLMVFTGACVAASAPITSTMKRGIRADSGKANHTTARITNANAKPPGLILCT